MCCLIWGLLLHTFPEHVSESALVMQARRLIVNAVLATDMTQHVRLLDAFSSKRKQQPNLAAWDDGDRDTLLQLVLHTADLCNPCRPLLFSIKWGELICCEFLEQVRLLAFCMVSRFSCTGSENQAELTSADLPCICLHGLLEISW